MTMIEVARLAGVSQATVSRVINRSPQVSNEMIESVNKAMLQLGYKPKHRRTFSREKAPALPAKTSGGADPDAILAAGPGVGCIALLILDKSMDWHPSLAFAKFRGVEQAVSREGLNLLVHCVTASGDEPPFLSRKDLAGVLLWGRRISPQLKSAIRRLPSVWLSSHDEAQGRRILAGNEQAGQLAAEYFLASGCRHPALLSPESLFSQCNARKNAFCYAMHRSGIEVAIPESQLASRIFEDLSRDEQKELIDRMIVQLLGAPVRPDSLFITDDIFAPPAYFSLMRRGIRPMADIRIVSCGNDSSCLAGLFPRPTAIDVAPETTGRLAVEQLLCEIRNPGGADRVSMLIEPRIVPGEEWLPIPLCEPQIFPAS